jgi:hypothetical protein
MLFPSIILPQQTLHIGPMSARYHLQCRPDIGIRSRLDIGCATRLKVGPISDADIGYRLAADF